MSKMKSTALRQSPCALPIFYFDILIFLFSDFDISLHPLPNWTSCVARQAQVFLAGLLIIFRCLPCQRPYSYLSVKSRCSCFMS